MENGKGQMSFLELKKDLRQESIFNDFFVENEKCYNSGDNENILILGDLMDDGIALFEEAEEIWMWEGAQTNHHGKVIFLKSPDQAVA